MRTAIYISGLLLLVSFLLILQDDFNQEWKQTQQAFANIEENRFYSTEAGGTYRAPGVRQSVIGGLHRVDRCMTCHLGVEDLKYAQADVPFASHPGNILDQHKVNDFGCTACHLGQGFAVTFEKAAHDRLEHWNETMLPNELLQAGCGTCHLSEEVEQAPMLSRGRQLIKDKGCVGCHDVNDFFEEEARGPDLAGVGNKVTAAWLFSWLSNPREYLKNARMPEFRLSAEEKVDLMVFLLGLNTKDSPPHYISEIPTEVGDEDEGQILVGESRCISCHTIHDRGGKLAPELERVGDKVQKLWLANFLRNVHYYQPKKVMLEYNFSDQDALDISSFIFEEYSDEDFELPETISEMLPKSEAQRSAKDKSGRRLFGKLGCDGCHAIGGERLSPKVGPKLTNVGNRLESGLDFGGAEDIVPTLYNWLFMKVKHPTVFDSSSTMPDFYLTDQEALEITIALLGNRDYGYSAEYLVSESEGSVYKKPAGEFGRLFDQFSCISCHSIDKYGGELSTAPLTMEGSKVQFQWLQDYLIRPYAIRPTLTERMPRFRMTEREAAIMADYIKKVYVSDEIPRFFEYELKNGDAGLGKQLFNELECRSCHIIDKTGGYVGPQLDDVGDRLEAGWMFIWLMDPLKYKKGTIHPDYGFSEDQARLLTAYLMTRRKR